MDWWIAASLAAFAVVLWLVGRATVKALVRGRRRRQLRRRIGEQRRRGG